MSESPSTLPEPAPFGDWLTARRRDAGLSRAELAGRLGINEDTYRAWEENRSRPKDRDRPAVAAALGVPLQWLSNAAAGGDAYIKARAAQVRT